MFDSYKGALGFLLFNAKDIVMTIQKNRLSGQNKINDLQMMRYRYTELKINYRQPNLHAAKVHLVCIKIAIVTPKNSI